MNVNQGAKTASLATLRTNIGGIDTNYTVKGFIYQTNQTFNVSSFKLFRACTRNPVFRRNLRLWDERQSLYHTYDDRLQIDFYDRFEMSAGSQVFKFRF